MQYRQLHRARLAKRKETVEAGTARPDETGTFDADTIPTTYQEPDNLALTLGEAGNSKDEDDRSTQVSILTSATSFVSDVDQNVGVRIPDLSNMILEGVSLQYGHVFECPYCRTIQKVENRFEWKYLTLFIIHP